MPGRQVCFALVVIALAAPCRAQEDSTSVLPDWTAVGTNFFPLAPAAVVQPAVTGADVTDAHAYFVADPFLFQEKGIWYLFFEATVPLGVIAVATSNDALHWNYERIVLRETAQVSFPSVFKADGEFYMTPETTAWHAVRLYRAASFPRGWTLVSELVTGRDFADPTIFRYHGRWWMFVSNAASDTCWLYSSDTLESGWVEHPASPIIAGNRARARPAGRGLVLQGDRVFRLAQNDTPNYGHAVRLFEVDVLTPETYHENLSPDSPILNASGAGWNADGMHTCDPWWTGDHWIAAVDGQANGQWSIGIYTTPVPVTGVPIEPDAAAGRSMLQSAPNPFGRTTRISYRLSPAPGAASGQFLISDAAGRIVRSERLTPWPAAGSFLWDGRDASGQRLPAGVYYGRAACGDRAATVRLVILR